LCFSEKPILPGYEVKITLGPSSDKFRIMTNTKPEDMEGDKHYTLEITEAKIYCPVGEITPKLFNEINAKFHDKTTDKTTRSISYPYRYIYSRKKGNSII
jgi:hypothetical protein